MTREQNQHSVECKICNSFSTMEFDKDKLNEWLAGCYTGEYGKITNVWTLVDMFNEKILDHEFRESAPGEEITFDTESLRKYIDARFIDTKKNLDQKTWNIGNAIAEKYDLDLYDISNKFINTNDMKRHMSSCLGVSQPSIDEDTRLKTDIDDSISFATKVLKDVLNKAKRKNKTDDRFTIEINIRCDKCGHVHPISELLKRPIHCPYMEGEKSDNV